MIKLVIHHYYLWCQKIITAFLHLRDLVKTQCFHSQVILSFMIVNASGLMERVLILPFHLNPYQPTRSSGIAGEPLTRIQKNTDKLRNSSLLFAAVIHFDESPLLFLSLIKLGGFILINYCLCQTGKLNCLST